MKLSRWTMPQSVEMFRALKSNGVPTHLYVAPARSTKARLSEGPGA